MIPDGNELPFSEISVDIAVYDDGYRSDGKHAASVNLNKANPGQFTPPTIIRMFANGARSIRNIKLCIVDSGEVTVSSSGAQLPDGSMTFGNAGVAHGQTPDLVVESYFKGLNQTGLADDVNNVSILNGSPNSSEYIALNVRTPDKICDGYLAYRWFFDFVE